MTFTKMDESGEVERNSVRRINGERRADKTFFFFKLYNV